MTLLVFFFLSRDDRIRTYDILLPKQARYQAALHPVANIYVTTQSAKYAKLFFGQEPAATFLGFIISCQSLMSGRS
jgi:hypothetical protein